MQKLFDYLKITSQIEPKILCCDSRLVKSTSLFFAIKGASSDGNKFIDDVINKGVKFIVTDDAESLKNPNIIANGVHVTLVSDARVALSQAANILYPLLPQYMVAATGTNGKTSVVSYCRQLYTLLGVPSCSIGTIGVECSGGLDLTSIQEILDKSLTLTTPDPVTFRHILHKLAENGTKYLAFEASSHGLEQQRLCGIKVDAACFTSFSQDHLDYHKNMDNYLLAKLKLFTDNLSQTGVAVLNSEIGQLDYIKSYLQERNIKFLTVGMNGDLKIIDSTICTYNGQKYNFTTDIVGSFQATNLLIAVMMVHLTGFPFEQVISKLPQIKAVKGRLERVANSNIFIDYAHTPDALEKSLLELKKIKSNKGSLKVIFGCGGNRDSSKRPLMGEIAAKIADEVIITDDNPRDEDPKFIRQHIIQAIIAITNSFIEIKNRKIAIIETINNLQEDDILLIAGKGHENYQIIGNEKLPFSDFDIAKEALQSRKRF
ncbi:MAG: UDP-N-acetylmuramoyl-L-alanyl-D-glutamate--2,6-diaminopimelate ligase [Rickettsia endosymbiont of Sergentomyia squamirostris]|uniref:UDP-N-acetylmuramoyl-L-alanyl-D-glutamate--2,6-diaminopimelate ligase n=1 Tax=Candidatus Tisiphia endosymbiont of Sergentomyia squamirostris TaxID=3113639 RepID=A0AAT9G763_9RICK